MTWKRITATSVGLLALTTLMFKMSTGAPTSANRPSVGNNPYESQVREQVRKLKDPSVAVRTGAAESLGFLRAYSASAALRAALDDAAPEVRRQAVMSLGWCGGRADIPRLLSALDDSDWSVGQAANVALKNLTGMEFPFNALSDAQTRRGETLRWREWWTKASRESSPSDLMSLLTHANPEARLRAVRALGALGGPEAAPKLIEILRTYTDRTSKQASPGSRNACASISLTPTERHLAQASIRALGRLHASESSRYLISLLENPIWSRYAADALGDLGSPDAVTPMLTLFPRFSRALEDHEEGARLPKLCPADDVEITYGTEDRMFETPYAMIQALSRLPLDGHVDELRRIAPYLVANMPSDFDGAFVYQPEPWQLITAYLLDKANLRKAACDGALRAAGESDKWFSAEAIRKKTKAPRGRAALDQVEEQPGLGSETNPRSAASTPRPIAAAGESLAEQTPEEIFYRLATHLAGDGGAMPSDVPYMASWLPSVCGPSDIPRLISLLDHDNGWIRINAVKTLMFLDAKQAVEPIARRLAASHPEAEYGYSGALEVEEYQDPAPRTRDVLMRALGHFQATQYEGLIIRILEDDRNVVDMQYAAAQTLDQFGSPNAIAALKRAAANHPFRSVRLIAQEALWRRGIQNTKAAEPSAASAVAPQAPADVLSTPQTMPSKYVFIRGENTLRSEWNTEAGLDPWRETSTLSNPGPTTREGRNLYILNAEGSAKQVTPLTNFDSGFVADCEVSWDGKKIIFARRRNDDPHNYSNLPYSPARLRKPGEFELDGKDDPWWHIWEIGVDGAGLRQVTHGPYHDVQPAYLPDGRIVFSSSRIGLRDEYHMFTATGLAVMNSDGSRIQVIGLNVGADRDPSVLPDGRIAFARLDVFYTRLKTEMAIQATYPDGTHNVAVYGPERRPLWTDLSRKYSLWAMLPSSDPSDPDNRNRVLKLGQPQGLPDGRIVVVSPVGLALVGPGATEEKLVPHDRRYAVTSPFPIGNGKVVAAASPKQFKIGDRVLDAGSPELEQYRQRTRFGYQFADAVNIDLGLYVIDLESGEMVPLFNDPRFAEFEPRPIMARRPPPQLPEAEAPESFTGKLLALSAFITRPEQDNIRTRGELVRVIEGQPFVTRRQTNKSIHANGKFRWKNHGGTLARVLGTFPLAADGSFYLQVPSNRLLQLQVLDSDRQVVGNELFWNYTRPGETKSCVGCHEPTDVSAPASSAPLAIKTAPLTAMPHTGEFTYRAKTWLKGKLPDAVEERTRTVRAVSLIGRN